MPRNLENLKNNRIGQTEKYIFERLHAANRFWKFAMTREKLYFLRT